jgi:amino acid adenylation domain-containing protein/non-ribosomal peptide synthase protein (TIGR01720 family)
VADHDFTQQYAQIADAQARRALLTVYLQARISRVLHIDASRLAPHMALDNLGIDSLMAVELQHEIESGLNLIAPASIFLEGQSIDSLATALLDQLTTPDDSAAVVLQSAKEALSEHPPSQGQRALWFLQQLAPESAAYNLCSAFRITGALDLAALRRAFQVLVDRHAALRTTFVNVQGELRQRIAGQAEVGFDLADAAGWSDERLRAHLSDLPQRPFDLARGPLLRVQTFARSANEHIVLVTVHHIVADFWSLVVLIDELRRVYLASPTAALAPLRFQYTDYVRWQTELLASPAGERLWGYWHGQLAEPLPVMNLPTDRPRPPLQSYRGAAHSFGIKADLTSQLKALAMNSGATLFMTLLAAFQVLLHRYTGQVDLLVGSPTAGRSRAGLADLVGYFVNPVVLRAELAGDPRFSAFVKRVRQMVLAALAHQDYPFAVLVDRLKPERDPSYSPLFQVLFVLEQPQGSVDPQLAPLVLGVPGAHMDLAELRLEAFPLEQRTAQFDLALAIKAGEHGLQATLRYNSDLFQPTTIRRMAGHLLTLLEGLAIDPELRLSDLPLLTTAERSQLLVTWNDTQMRFAEPEELCVQRLVEAQVERSPDAVALVFEDRCLTYRELNVRANQLAHYLRALGVGLETRVGICVDRSLETTLAFLAVFKAGGAYVPLDPAYPPDRIAFILADAHAPVLLTQTSIYNVQFTIGDAERPQTASVNRQSKIVNLDADWPSITQASDQNLPIAVTPEHLAYVMYTSGSTGMPKGVMVPHRGVGNRVLWMRAILGLTAHDRLLHKASFGFDASVWEMFLPLSSGACLVVGRPGAQHDNAHLVELIIRERLTMVHFVPSLLKLFLEQPGLENCTTVRRVWCGGEAMPLALKQRFYARLAADLYNGYGPTEGTINATYWPCERGDQRGMVPIGRPVANYQIYILDPHMRPMPIGVPGELFIGGIGVARGYLARPDLTAERFIPNPFLETKDERRRTNDEAAARPGVRGPSSGDRLYATGDLARYLPDANIEFLGRTDQQVKLRGVRIELGEIEAVLRQHPRVRAAAVLIWEDANVGAAGMNRRLVAYVVPAADERRTTNDESASSSSVLGPSSLVSELRDFLRSRLPAYILPAAFVVLDALPVTPNGKLDSRALPTPERDRHDFDAGYVAPHTPVEKLLVRIWAEVLGITRVGIHDNFFALGGDSILSIQIVGRAQQAGLRFSPNQMFQHQTIAELAAVAVAAQATQAEQAPLSGALPLTPIQRRFFEQNLPDPEHWNQALLLAARQPVNPLWLKQALESVLAHHDALRLRFTRTEAGWQQLYAGAVETVPLVRLDLSALPAAQQPATITMAAGALQPGLRLPDGPLLRMALFDLGPHAPSRIVIIVHHLLIDGVSWRILLEDLQTAYAQLSQGEAVALSLKTISYRRWAERLSELARSEALALEGAYWLAEAYGRIAPLPIDRQNGDNREESVRTVSIALSAEETRALLQEVPAAYHTQINDVLLAALAQAFARWTGMRRLLVDLESQGREELIDDGDVSRTIGWFTALFPVLLDLGPSEHPGENLTTIKEQLRRIPRHGIGYGLLRYLRGDASIAERLGALPQAEVIFNYLGQFDQVIAEHSLFGPADESVGPLRSPRGTRRYLLEINGLVLQRRLHFDWRYSEQVHRRATIERLAQDFIDALRALIDHCLSPQAGGYTPSDFGAFNWDQTDLDDIIGGIRKSLGDA